MVREYLKLFKFVFWLEVKSNLVNEQCVHLKNVNSTTVVCSVLCKLIQVVVIQVVLCKCKLIPVVESVIHLLYLYSPSFFFLLRDECQNFYDFEFSHLFLNTFNLWFMYLEALLLGVYTFNIASLPNELTHFWL